MIAEDLINQMIPPLKYGDTAQKALDWMEKLRINQLPVVDGPNFKGIIAEDTILDIANAEILIENIPLFSENIYAHPGNHFYDLIKLASQHKLQIVPVLDADKKYLGVVSVNETATSLAKMFASQGPGGILVISLAAVDYSLAEIARLVESNNTKIVSSFFYTEENAQLSQLTLKLNSNDMSRTIATLERHSYNVVAHFQEKEFLNIDQERLDLLFKYLNI